MRAAEQVFVGIPGTELDAPTTRLLSEHPPGGIVLFKRNIKDPEQLNALVTDLRRLLPEAVFAIDQEGGRVDRLKDVVAPAPAGSVLARHAPSLSYQAGTWVAHALRLFDIDLDFAPVVDLDRGEKDNGLDDRYLGAGPAEVIVRAQAFLRGLHAGGVGGCIKHFPGLGAAPADTHFKVASIFLPSDDLRRDLEPFEALCRFAGAVMVSHAVYPAYDTRQRPATLSPPIVQGLLRDRVGFEGLVMSDDLEMDALKEWGDLAERSELALEAGCDVLLVCHTLEALPGIVARLEQPRLADRLGEAHRRLDAYRQRLQTLRSAQDYIATMRESGRGERLEKVRQMLEQIQISAGKTTTA
jgi:beta-N-acetylhexosaminidase